MDDDIGRQTLCRGRQSWCDGCGDEVVLAIDEQPDRILCTECSEKEPSDGD